ncbi:MAG: hypothetical protein OHK0037_01020 [Elainellaceae cyanobacterium]
MVTYWGGSGGGEGVAGSSTVASSGTSGGNEAIASISNASTGKIGTDHSGTTSSDPAAQPKRDLTKRA